MFGKKMIDLFKIVKNSFDPTCIFNPGKLLMLQNWILGNILDMPSYNSENINTILDWSLGQEIRRISRCN